MSEKEKNNHIGHRQRMRDKFLAEGNFDSFPAHNILEMLLFYSIPRADTNETAHELLNTFGSLKGVFEADVSSLCTIPGIGENSAVLIKMIPSILRAYQNEATAKTNFIHSPEEAAAYLKPRFTGINHEALYMICLNNESRILKTVLLNKGGFDFAGVDMRRLINEAITCNATGVIIAHNHPGGVCAPSAADKDITFKISKLLSNINISFLDHIIITESTFCSLSATDICRSLFQSEWENRKGLSGFSERRKK